MDRRSFIESCSAGAACLTASAALPVLAADARPRAYARVLLTNEFGDALKASSLQAQTNYVFHYPFEATPVFLLNLGRAAPRRRWPPRTARPTPGRAGGAAAQRGGVLGDLRPPAGVPRRR
ncbi:MAG: hypothetical protein IPK34_08990 [Ramlibacter sp.]|nr:hypothetical protein [Ramlibacter sp.]